MDIEFFALYPEGQLSWEAGIQTSAVLKGLFGPRAEKTGWFWIGLFFSLYSHLCLPKILFHLRNGAWEEAAIGLFFLDLARFLLYN